MKLAFRQVEETMVSKKDSDDPEKALSSVTKGSAPKRRKEEPHRPSQRRRKRKLPLEKRSPEQKAALPEISFINLILSLSTSALIQLGEIQDPTTQQAEKNLPLAQQTIDLISLLQEKTKET